MTGGETHRALEPSNAPSRVRCDNPSPHDLPCRARVRAALGNLAGLTQFGVNGVELPPGAWSRQRHWHSREEEFVRVLDGEVVFVTDEGEQVLGVESCAWFKAGVPNGHHLQNRSDRGAVVPKGSRRLASDRSTYPDIDLRWNARDGYSRGTA